MGGCRDSVRSLNFFMDRRLEKEIHEIFLRFRSPTSGAPHILSDSESADSWSSNYRYNMSSPILSGGSHWPVNWPQSVPDRPTQNMVLESKMWADQLRILRGEYDDPSCVNQINTRTWIRNPEKPDEFISLKERYLNGWSEWKLGNCNIWRRTTQKEKDEESTDDWEIVWQRNVTDDKNITNDNEAITYKRKAPPERKNMYTDAFNIRVSLPNRQQRLELIEKRKGIKRQNIGEHGDNPDTALDGDLIIQRLYEKWGIDVFNDTHVKEIEMADDNLTKRQWATFPHWNYFE
eukprot:GHVL01027201.1.p1 GENE.GHVL01027201.1~~GHVL01027201.1.p1  ORF type:complete len:291 (-),score=55.85 GHVL01027201.1:108-980(-)